MPHPKAANSIPWVIGFVFCLAGLAILLWAVAAAPLGGQSWIIAAFGLAFGGFGLLPLYLTARARKKEAQRERLRALHPEEPWMHREDWAQGRAQSTTRSGMFGAWFFTIFWNAVSSPILPILLFRSELVEEAGQAAYFALMFPLIGLGLLIWAVRMTIRWRTFGKTWFEMAAVPGELGKALEGRVWAHFARPPDRGVVVKLTCFNRYVTDDGKNRSTNERILWREERTVPLGAILSSPTASAIPVRFPLPADAPETNTENSANSIHWVLAAEASVPGVDYHDEFEVPVFRTKERSGAADFAAEPAAIATTQVSLREIEKSGIRVGPSATGGTEFYFTAARNLGAAAGTTAFFGIWSVILWFLYHSDGSDFIFRVFLTFFTVMVGFVEVLLFVVVLQLWFATFTVTVGSGAVITRHGILGLGFTRTAPVSQIAGLKMEIGMQSGGRHGTPYYNIQMVLTDGKERCLASEIRDKRQAEWLLAQLCASTGLMPLS